MKKFNVIYDDSELQGFEFLCVVLVIGGFMFGLLMVLY